LYLLRTARPTPEVGFETCGARESETVSRASA